MTKVSMMAVLAAVSLGLPMSAAVGDDVPTYDMRKSCKADVQAYSTAQSVAGLSSRIEQNARATLVSQWTQFAPESRSRCSQMVGDVAGPQKLCRTADLPADGKGCEESAEELSWEGTAHMEREQYQQVAIVAGALAVIVALMSGRLPRWLRIVLVLSLGILGAGAGLFEYRYFTQPTTLTIATGSLDGDVPRIMSAIAARMASTNAPVRLKVVDKADGTGGGERICRGQSGSYDCPGRYGRSVARPHRPDGDSRRGAHRGATRKSH